MANEQEKMEMKLSALFLVQFLGLVIAFILAWFGQKCYTYVPITAGPYTVPLFHYTIGPYTSAGPFAILWPALATTVILFLFTKQGLSATLNAGRWSWHRIRSLNGETGHFVTKKYESKSWQLRLAATTAILGSVDMVGSAFCIRATGGAEGSIFTPFLLIVPTIIVLIAIFDTWIIIAGGGFCVVLFAKSIEKFAGFSYTNLDYHHHLLVISTAICIFFPFVYLKQSQGARKCPKCAGTGLLNLSDSSAVAAAAQLDER